MALVEFGTHKPYSIKHTENATCHNPNKAIEKDHIILLSGHISHSAYGDHILSIGINLIVVTCKIYLYSHSESPILIESLPIFLASS